MTPEGDSSSVIQDSHLAVIRDATAILSRARVEHWLTGGWAVDFLYGEVSRSHKDIDLVIRARDAEAAVAALSASLFEQLEPSYPDERLEFTRDGVTVELIFITSDARGRLVTPGRWAQWPWPSDTLSGPVGQIGTLSCRLVSVAAQIDSKRNYSSHGTGELRERDLHDLRRLEAFAEHS
ncbi:MAG TPA: hypothetical protein VGU02_00070 [Gaiellaceae bacterium]|nr:hypothetical protein [Gaiellaceae bacterium]